MAIGKRYMRYICHLLFVAVGFTFGANASAQTGEWTWMGGSNSGNASGIYGTLGTPAAANVPGARTYGARWTDSTGNFWVFGGLGNDVVGNYNNLNDLWRFSPSTSQWTWMGGSSIVPATSTGNGGQSGVYGALSTFAPGNVPGSRRLSSSWADNAGHLWLFGGYGYDSKGNAGDLNDLWEFNLSTNQWAWVSGSNTLPMTTNSNGGYPGVYGTLGTSAIGNVPGGRLGATSWIDSTGHLWIFGGHGFDSKGNAGDLNDLWEFTPSTNQWTWMSGSNTTVLNGGQPGVYGTLGKTAAGNVPGSRSGAAGWIDSTGNLWLFGGAGWDANGITSVWLNDLWQFNPFTKQWAWMGGSSTIGVNGGQPGVYGTLGTPAAASIPGGRLWASTWTDGTGHLWLFGGEGLDSAGKGNDLNDLWEFNPFTNQWTWMGGSNTVGNVCFNYLICGQPGAYGTLGIPAAGNVPGGRFSSSSWIDSSGHLWLFGGEGFDSTGHQNILNDLWTFQPTVPSSAATPTFSVPAGNYSTPQTVALSDTTTGATIYYTTDGTTPSTSSTKYTGVITVSSSETLEAIATASGYSTSAVATVTYTIGATVPVVTLSPTSITFTSQTTGTTSAAQSVTLTNSAQATLTLSSIAASGDFAQANNCGTSVAAGSNCTISVTFTPTAAVARTGTLTIKDNANGSPHTIALSGTGVSFGLTSSSTSLTASPEGSTTATLQISPVNGFTGTVNLTCVVNYQGQGTPTSPPTCSLNPSRVQISGASPISSTLTVSTTAATASLSPGWALKGSGVALTVLLFGRMSRRRWAGRLRAVLCLVATVGMVGCAGGSGSSSSGGNQTNTGTTKGSYQVVVTAASDSATTSTTIPLAVQ